MQDFAGFHSLAHEKIVRAFSTHWIKYVAPVAVFVIVLSASIAMLVIAGLTTELIWVSRGLLFAGLIFLNLSVHWFFHRLLSEAMEDIVITTKRIIWIKESLFAIEDVRQIPLDKIQGVEAKKVGLSQTVLRYGTLWFDTGGTVTIDKNATISQVPHPNDVARQINQLLRIH